MIEIELFLGIPLTPSLLKDLAEVDPSLVQMFVREDGDYLRRVSYKGAEYLGKSAGDVCELSSLELLQTNIYSFLDKLLPASSCQSIPLELFPVAI